MKEPTTAITAKHRDSVVSRIDELAEIFGMTRSRLVAWATEETVERTYSRIDELRAMRQGLPAIPTEVLG